MMGRFGMATRQNAYFDRQQSFEHTEELLNRGPTAQKRLRRDAPALLHTLLRCGLQESRI